MYNALLTGLGCVAGLACVVTAGWFYPLTVGVAGGALTIAFGMGFLLGMARQEPFIGHATERGGQ